MIYTITLNPTIDRTMRFSRLSVGDLNRATYSRTDLSGKGVNVSIGLRMFGVPSVAMGFAAGVSGRVLVDGLRAQGYDCDFVVVEGETRSNITVIDDTHGVTTKLNEAGPAISEADMIALEARLMERVGANDICVFSGNLPPDAPADTYARLIESVRRRGALAVLDTSGQALAAGCVAAPDLLKPNTDEASELTGRSFDGPEQWSAGLAAILAMGPRRVLLSADSRGAAYVDDGSVWAAQPPEIREVSAVGAGDALLSGALWAWQQGLPSREVTRWAVATGTAAATIEGSALPTLRQVTAVYAGVRTYRLAEIAHAREPAKSRAAT